MRERRANLIFILCIITTTAAIILSGAFYPAAAEDLGQNTSGIESSNSDDNYVAYYFHGNKRCSTCKKLEQYSEEGVHSTELIERTGLNIPLKIVNVQTPENSHFMNDFDLYTQSLVITEITDGRVSRWENLDQIWMLVRDKEKYIKYVEDEICSFVKGE